MPRRFIVSIFIFWFGAAAAADFQYDVVVIGAGPGGLAAAIVAARAGARALVLEQRTLDGSDGKNAWGTRRRVVAVDESTVRLVDSLTDSQVPFSKIRDFTFLTDTGKMVIPQGDAAALATGVAFDRNFGGTIPINELEKGLLAAAKANGVEVMFGAEALNIVPHAVKTAAGKVSSKIIIDSEGSKGALLESAGFHRSGLGFRPARWVLANFVGTNRPGGQYKIETRTNGKRPFYSLALRAGNITTVGTSTTEGDWRGLTPEQVVRASAKELGVTGVYQNDVAEVGAYAEGQDHFSDPKLGLLVVGDAARKVDPITGFGVTLAVSDCTRVRDFVKAALTADDSGVAALARAFEKKMRDSVVRAADQSKRFQDLRWLFGSQSPILKLGLSAAIGLTRFFSIFDSRSSWCETALDGGTTR